MKIIELLNKLQLPITNEEFELLSQFVSDTPIQKRDLTEREQYLATQLTVKDVLLRTNEDGRIYYRKQIN
jgi:hypothetical protein